MRRSIGFRVMVLSDRRSMAPDPASAVAALFADRTFDPSTVAFQWREKDLAEEATRAFLGPLRDALPAGTTFLLNAGASGALELASEFGLSVHLPEAGPSVLLSRVKLRSDAVVGRSVHSPDAARQAQAEGADYVMFGPIFPTFSKQDLRPAVGVRALHDVAAAVEIPVVAVGGIDSGRAWECMAAGAQGVAVIGSIWRAANPPLALTTLALAASASPRGPGCGGR